MKNIFNLNSKKEIFFFKKKSRLFKIQPLIFLLNHLFFQSFLSMCYYNHCFSYQKSGISPDSSFHPGQPSHQPILSISLLNSSSYFLLSSQATVTFQWDTLSVRYFIFSIQICPMRIHFLHSIVQNLIVFFPQEKAAEN